MIQDQRGYCIYALTFQQADKHNVGSLFFRLSPLPTNEKKRMTGLVGVLWTEFLMPLACFSVLQTLNKNPKQTNGWPNSASAEITLDSENVITWIGLFTEIPGPIPNLQFRQRAARDKLRWLAFKRYWKTIILYRLSLRPTRRRLNDSRIFKVWSWQAGSTVGAKLWIGSLG